MNDVSSTVPGRKYELDWLRVIVTINLIPFHVAWMMTSVNGFSFVEKGTVAWNILHGYVQFVSPLHMYLLFLVAGTSAFLSLHSRSSGQYAKERVRRLLIPVFAFMIFLFPVMGYFWPPAQFMIGIDFFKQFWPWCLSTTFYSPVTGGPNWGHMWFAGYLFIYSLVLLPAFLRMRTGKGPLGDSKTRFLTGRPGAIFLAGIPIALTFAVLSPIWPFFRNNLYSDWGYFAYNMTAFVFGFIIARDPEWIRTFERHTAAALVLGIVFSAVKMFMQYKLPSFSTPAYNMNYAFFSLIAGLNTWFWVIAILSIALRSLSFTNRCLKYFNRISYPMYIFHLVVISVAGHFITRMRLGIIAEFGLICAVTFVICVAVCELAKRTPVTRFLFGIKGR
jgi:glucan biosynthesis protein C